MAMSVGSHVAWLMPLPPASVKQVREVVRSCAAAELLCPGVKVPVPVVVVDGPDQYLRFARGTVFPALVKVVDDTEAVHDALVLPRLSTTCTEPSAPLIVLPSAPLPRFAVLGNVIDSEPPLTARVKDWVALGVVELLAVIVNG